MQLLTVFTPTYNRKHTIIRTYESLLRQTCKDFQWLIIDDGSSDGTKEWVLSLAESIELRAERFDWMGRRLVEAGSPEFRKFFQEKASDKPNDNGNSEPYLKPETSETLKQKEMDHFVIEVPFPDNEGSLRVEYIYKPNGGLYTGYNVAYATIQTELCVCIDSDDFMPDDAVEKISRKWHEYYPQGSLINNQSPVTNNQYCGIVGLDYNVIDKNPIGGKFAEGVSEGNYFDIKRGGDTKEVLRTALMKTVSPQIGFEGEKDFNPFYMISQIVDKYPILVENSNLCWVEYQVGGDSMSKAIFKQYKRSARSFTKMRLNEMTLTSNNNVKSRIRICAHYISSCIFICDKNWLKNSPLKMLTIISIPFGIIINILIRIKSRS